MWESENPLALAKLIFSQDGELYLGTLSYFFVWVGGMDKGTRQKKVVQGLFKTKMSELFKYLNFNFFWAQAKLIFSQDGELYLGTLLYFFVWVGEWTREPGRTNLCRVSLRQG